MITTTPFWRTAVLTMCGPVMFSSLSLAVSDEPPPVDPQIQSILDRVEARGQTVNDLQCRVVYIVEDRIADDRVKREGNILYKKKEPNPIFLVTVEKVIQEGVVSRSKSWWLFDGRWLYEAKQRSKSTIIREIAPPGEKIDLFSLESAPFPIPFGQKTSEILDNFAVELVSGHEGDPPETDHLVCTPKPDSRFAKDYTKLEFFVSRSLHLPVRIVMTENPPDKETAADFPDLSDGSLNTGLDDSRFRLPAETKKYTEARE